jgi:hypothetical protein
MAMRRMRTVTGAPASLAAVTFSKDHVRVRDFESMVPSRIVDVALQQRGPDAGIQCGLTDLPGGCAVASSGGESAALAGIVLPAESQESEPAGPESTTSSSSSSSSSSTHNLLSWSTPSEDDGEGFAVPHGHDPPFVATLFKVRLYMFAITDTFLCVFLRFFVCLFVCLLVCLFWKRADV